MVKRQPKKEFCLVSLTGKYIVKRGGKPVTIVAAQPPRGEDFPRKYRNAGYSYEAVEVEQSVHHRGEPLYVLQNSQCGRVTKIIGANN